MKGRPSMNVGSTITQPGSTAGGKEKERQRVDAPVLYFLVCGNVGMEFTPTTMCLHAARLPCLERLQLLKPEAQLNPACLKLLLVPVMRKLIPRAHVTCCR